MWKRYIIVDMERTIGNKVVTYWKSGKRGYTRTHDEAGKYLKDHAIDIVESDVGRTSVMIPSGGPIPTYEEAVAMHENMIK